MRIRDVSSDVCSADLDRALHVGVEGVVDRLDGGLAQREHASRAGIGEDDVEGSALRLHLRVEPVEVGRIGDRAPNRTGIGSEFGQGRVERFLTAAEDEDECAVLAAAFCRRDADAGGAAGKDRKSTRLNSSHYCPTRIPSYASKKKKKH